LEREWLCAVSDGQTAPAGRFSGAWRRDVAATLMIANLAQLQTELDAEFLRVRGGG
jgi:hypothetical protein